MLQFPIELGHHVIHPALGSPLEAVGIKGVITLQAIGFAAVRVTCLITPNAKGADAKTHPGFDFLNGVVHLLNEQVHVMAAPIVLIPTNAVQVIRSRIGELGSLDRIGIEIIVHVQGIDIIAHQDIPDHSINKVAALGQAWVEIEFSVGILEEPLGMLIVDVALGRLVILAAGHTIGVDPSMQFHAAKVGLIYHELQGVPFGTGCLARLTSEPARPRFQFTGIACIGLWPNLPDDRITVGLLQEVELLDEILTHLLGRHLGILALPDDMHPGTTELILGLL